MTEPTPATRGVLYVIICGSSSAPRAADFIMEAQKVGWSVCVITTPQARKFLNISQLEQITRRSVRSEYKHPDEPDLFPRADALVVLPASFNTLNKWVLGISDTLAVGLLCEYTGRKIPIVAIPGVTNASGLDTHPAFSRSINLLREYGVHIIYEREKYAPRNEVPCDVILDELDKLIAQNSD